MLDIDQALLALPLPPVYLLFFRIFPLYALLPAYVT